MVYSEVTIDDGAIDYELIEAFRRGLKPTPLLTVSQWADKHRYLSSEASAEHGKWRTERTPYLRKPQDCASPTSTYYEIYCIKASQQGFTEFMLNVLATFMDIAPCPAMYIMPTINMAKSFSKSRVTPMIDACPNLNSKIKPARERDANNTVLEKSYPGGLSIFTGSNSAAELSSRPIRVLFGDELDRYPTDVDGEGSPWELAKKRTLTFSNRKIVGISTPTIKGISFIERLVEDTDQQKYFVQLPCCEGEKQSLEFEQLRYEAGDYISTKYECIHCAALIDERYKAKFLPELGYGGTAEWIATVPEKSSKTKIGFVINGLYSPLGWLSWAQITEEYERVKDNVVLLRTFWNTVLGRSFAEKTDTPPWENLYNRRELYNIGTCPDDVLFITMGVDVQRDRLEMEVVGWCEGKESYSIEYLVISGDTAGIDVWNQLSFQIDKVYYKLDQTPVPIRMTAIDTGYNTTHVYTFCRRFDPGRVIPIKGQAAQQTVIRTPSTVDVKTRSGKKTGTIKLWHFGVSVIKSEIYGWMRQEKIEGPTPPGYMHFPQYNVEYFKGLTAEALVLKVVKGYNTYVWQNVYGRNEPLDCRAYARGAAAVIGMDRLTPQAWAALRVALSKVVIKKAVLSTIVKEKKKKVKRNQDFW